MCEDRENSFLFFTYLILSLLQGLFVEVLGHLFESHRVVDTIPAISFTTIASSWR